MAILYQHRRVDTNEVFYVGIGKSTKRAYSKHGRSKPWKDFTKEHSYFVEILNENLTWKQVCEKEKELIKQYGRRDLKKGPLVNMTDGGDGVENLPAETLKLIGSKIKGRPGTFLGKKHTEESKDRNRQAHLGKVPWMKGKKHTEEAKEKNRAKHVGKVPHNKGKIRMNIDGKITYVSVNTL